LNFLISHHSYFSFLIDHWLLPLGTKDKTRPMANQEIQILIGKPQVFAMVDKEHKRKGN
jgi:hypothetical protein